MIAGTGEIRIRESDSTMRAVAENIAQRGLAVDAEKESSRQDFDQPLQNSVKNTIAPAAVVRLHSVSAMGSEVLVVIVPAWNRTDVYQHADKILIRKGTNVFAARPEEVKRLHRGEAVV